MEQLREDLRALAMLGAEGLLDLSELAAMKAELMSSFREREACRTSTVGSPAACRLSSSAFQVFKHIRLLLFIRSRQGWQCQCQWFWTRAA